MAPASLGRLFGGGKSGAQHDNSARNGAKRGKAPQMLRPQDPTRPCPMAKLPEDLILHIFDLVQAASPQSTANLTLVHPQLYRQALYVQHRRVTVDLDNKHGVAEKRLEVIERHSLLPVIQELRVLSRFCVPDMQCLSRLAGMVGGMTGLRAVHWDYTPIPAAVLESLRQLPFPVQLHVVVRDEKGREQAPRQLLAALDGCGALVSLTLEATYIHASDCLELTRLLKQLLLTCPNLVNLTVDLHLPRHGCISFGPPTEYPGLGFSDGAHPLRPLGSLTLHEYPWGEKAQPGRFIFHSEGYPCDELEMDYWAANFDWSALRRLEASSPATQVVLATALAPRLTGLREAHFTRAHDLRGRPLERFFDLVPAALEAISVPSLAALDAAAFARHAPALRRLTLHQSETTCDADAWAANVLSPQRLGELAKQLPLLEELGLDVMRAGGDWPRDQLDALARLFPRLRALELWFGFGDWAVFGAPQPALTAAAAAQLFAGLRRARPGLQQLRVHSGYEPEPALGLRYEQGSYPLDNSSSFVCRVAERDDEAAAGGVDVTSLKLSPRLNARMRRIMKGEERREGVQGNLIALRVALDGPLKRGDWEQWQQRWPIPNLPALMDAAEGRRAETSRNSRGRLSRMWRR